MARIANLELAIELSLQTGVRLSVYYVISCLQPNRSLSYNRLMRKAANNSVATFSISKMLEWG